jgi:hypothetical protein
VAAWDVLPVFYDSAGMLDSATDFNVLRAAAGLIDRWTYRVDPVFDSTTGVDTNTPGYFSTITPLRIWWGAVRFQTGCTTLTVEMKGQLTGSESIKVYWNGTDATGSGTLAMTLTPPGSFGAFSGTYTLPALTDGAVYQIEVRIEGAHTAAATYQMVDVYLSPITKASYPGVPTFTASTVNAANLNLLASALQWMYERLRMVPMVPHLSLLYNLGPFKDPSSGDPQHTDRPIWYGSAGRYYSNSTLVIAGVIQSLTTTGWNFKIYINGSVVYTSPTYGIGNQAIRVTQSLSAYTLGTRVSVGILASATTGGTAVPLRFTRFTLGLMAVGSDGSGWPYASLPAKFVGPATGTSTFSTVVTALNALSTIVTNAKSRIDGRPEQWARVRALRRHYSRNADTEGLLVARARPHIPLRVGSELFVKGTNTEVQWGVFQPGTVDANSNGWESYSMSNKQQVADSALGATVYLDDLPGLDVGSTYMLFGDPLWVEEKIG